MGNPPQDKPVETPAAAKPESASAKFYESAYKPFEPKYNEVPKDKPAETGGAATPEQLKNGWQTGDATASAAFKALDGELKAFDTAEGKVREGQEKGPPPAFKDTTDPATGAVKRAYEGALKGYEHTFNKDGSVDLKMPTGESVRFHGDTATVTGADGKTQELDKTKTDELKGKVNKDFAAATGEFTVEGQTDKGQWKIDAITGNTTVEKVPGINGGSMIVNHPNTKDDVKYHGEVKGDGKKPGYSTEVTGDKQTGYRFVDYNDSTGVQATAGDARTADGRPVEGFVAQRKDGTDKAPLTLVSDKPAGDGSTTKIGLDGVAETTYDPPKDGKKSEKVYPPGHPSGLSSETSWDPKTHPDHVTTEKRFANGDKYTERDTGDGGMEKRLQGSRGEIIQKFAKPGDTTPQWSRMTDPEGNVSTRFANGEVATYKPGRAGPPEVKPEITLSKTKTNPDGSIGLEKVDDARLAEFMKAPPPVSSEKLSDGRTRDTLIDGRVVTTDTNSGITRTETPARPGQPATIEHSWKPETKPTPADLAKMTGLKADDPRLQNVTSVKEYPGSSPARVDVTYGPDTANVLKDGKPTTDVKTSAKILRDGDGTVLAEERSAQTKEGRKYTDVENPNGRTRTYEAKPGQPAGDQEVYNNKGEKVQDRVVDGKKITTTQYEGGAKKRTEVIDTEKNTWTRTEGDKTTTGTLLQGDKRQRLYMDGNKVGGFQIPGGAARGGDTYQFQRDAEGNLSGINIETQPHGDNAGKKATLEKVTTVEKDSDGKDVKKEVWKTNPPNAEIPGFPAANDPKERNADGSLKGQFTTNAKGELVYESGDKATKQILRGDGSLDTYNMRDYSRVKEDPNGKKGPTQYWDGYGSKANPEDGWREGKLTRDEKTGAVTVEFTTPMDNHPSKMTRNGNGTNDSFEVTFPNGTNFKVGNWGDGTMTRTTGSGAAAKTETLYNTGTVGSDGRVQWAKGTPDANGTVKIDDPRVQTGEMPAEIKAGKDKGTRVARYADGTEVESDLNGNAKRVKPGHKGSQMMKREYGKQGELKKFEQGTTTGTLDSTNPVDGTSDWTVNMGGKDYKITGAKVVEKPGGQFEIVGKDASGKEAKYESNGRLTAKETFKVDGKDVVRDVVVDARGQKWVKTVDAAPSSDPSKPGTPETWETGNPPKKFQGEMKRYENGNVAIQEKGKDYAETVNSDGSVSKLDAKGIERERNYPAPPAGDGTYQKRGPQGELVEFKSKDGSVTKLEYDRKPGTNELAGGVKEVRTTGPDGKVRVEKRDNPAPPAQPQLRVESGNPPKLGTETVEYDRMGTRYEIKGTATDNVTTATDIHGQTRSITMVGGKRMEISPGTTPDTKLKLNYTRNGDPNPHTIEGGKDGKEVYTRVDGETNVFTRNNQNYTLEKDGSLKPAENNSGLDPAFSMQLEAGRARDSRPADRPGTPQDKAWEGAEKILMDKYKDKGIKPGTIPELRKLAEAAGLKPEQVTPQAIDAILAAGAETNMLGTEFDPAKLKTMAKDLAPVMQPRGSDSWKNVMAALGDGNIDKIKAALPASVRPLVTEKFIGAIRKAFLQPAEPAPQR